MHELHVSKRKFSRSTEKARDNLRLEISSARAHEPNLCVFCEKVCPYFRDTSAHVDFFSPPNFVKPHQTSKTPSSCFGGGQFFVRREN